MKKFHNDQQHGTDTDANYIRIDIFGLDSILYRCNYVTFF